jgi:hypothetical protein
MARIRSVKPEFLRHAGLYRLEVETGLPCRMGFLGLWTAADREGRFKWRPEELKLDALPHDAIDFANVLEALRGGGHIVMYVVDGKPYGYIPSWHDHQAINTREAKSTIPDPTDEAIAEADGLFVPSNATHVHARACTETHTTRRVLAQGEGKGREGKGREGDSPAASQPPRSKPAAEAPTNATWTSYAEAYSRRYGVEPVRNRTVNGQLAQFIARIPADEAPSVAACYVAHENPLYRNAQHPVNLLLRDAESLRTQCVTGRTVGTGAGHQPAASFRERDQAAAAARVAEWSPEVAARPKTRPQQEVIDVATARLD